MKKQTFLKGSLILMLSAAAAKALGAFFRIPLTNMLGGVGMSYFSCAYSLFMPVYALVVTGISSSVARMTASRVALGLYGSVRRIRSTALLVFTAAGIPASALLVAFAGVFSRYSVGTTDAAPAAAMIAPAVVFGCITAVERGYYEGLSNMYPTALSQVAESIVRVAAGLWLCSYVTSHAEFVLPYFPGISDIRAIAAAAGILGVTLSSLGAAVFLGLIRLFSKPLPEPDECPESRRAIAGELVRCALPIGAGALVTNLTALIDMWTVIGCLSHTGAYEGVLPGVAAGEGAQFVYGSFSGIALTVFNLVPSVTNMLGKGALTNAAAAHGTGSREQLCRSSVQAILAAEVIALPAAAGLGLFAPEVLGLLFPRQPDEVRVCVGALRLLMPGMVFLCVSYPVFSMLQGVGRAGAPLKIMLIGTLLKLAGNLALIPLMGVDGAAASTSLCYAFILAAALRIYLRETGISPGVLPFLKVGYAGAVCGAAAMLASGAAAQLGTIAELFIAGAAGGTAYFVVLHFTLDKKQDRGGFRDPV